MFWNTWILSRQQPESRHGFRKGEIIMKYIIKIIGKRLYVSVPGSKHSYTNHLENAQIFPTPEKARENCCENERIYSTEGLIEGGIQK